MAKIVKNYVSLIRVETVRKTVDRQIKMYRSPALLKEKDAKNWIYKNRLKFKMDLPSFNTFSDRDK